MLQTLRDNGMESQKVTFPVRAIFGGKSVEQLQYLLNQSMEQSGTLTIWGTDDVPNIDELRNMMDIIGRDKIYLDVPKELADQLG